MVPIMLSVSDSSFYIDEAFPPKYLPGALHILRADLPKGYPLGPPALLSCSWPAPEKRIRAYCLFPGPEWHFVFCVLFSPRLWLFCCCSCAVTSRMRNPFPLRLHVVLVNILGGQGCEPTWGLVLVTVGPELRTEVLRAGAFPTRRA